MSKAYTNPIVQEIWPVLQISEIKASIIVQAVAKAMVKALRNGETIDIDGFGKFQVVTRPSLRKRPRVFIPGKKGFHGPCVEKIIPPKRVVKFTPYSSLKNYIKGD